jgi:hypothetical protein
MLHRLATAAQTFWLTMSSCSSRAPIRGDGPGEFIATISHCLYDCGAAHPPCVEFPLAAGACRHSRSGGCRARVDLGGGSVRAQMNPGAPLAAQRAFWRANDFRTCLVAERARRETPRRTTPVAHAASAFPACGHVVALPPVGNGPMNLAYPVYTYIHQC